MTQKPGVLLIASQMPQQELGIIAQILMSQGYRQQPASERSKGSASIAFETPDKANAVEIKFYQEIGALRLELTGQTSQKIGGALAQYMETLPAQRIGELFDDAQSDMERRIYAILLVLAYPDGQTAMDAIREKYFLKGTDATREGIVQGLAFLETPDVGIILEEIESSSNDKKIAALARRAIDGLSQRGIIRESVGSFRAKVEAVVDDNPKAALELIEKYEAGTPVPEIRALHARALRLLGKNDEAFELLRHISITQPDAVEAYCQRALLRETSGAVEQAIGDVRAALACDPDSEAASEIFARLSLVCDNSAATAEDRIARYTEALASAPEDANLLCQRAESLIETKRFDEAHADLIAAQKLTPNDLRLPKLLCEVYLGKRWYGHALEQSSRARDIHVPAFRAVSWLLKPKVFLAMNLPADALEALNGVPADLRDNEAVLLCGAIVQEILGNADESARIYSMLPEDVSSAASALDLAYYREMPLLSAHMAGTRVKIGHPPATALGDEPSDPYFKRCKSCGSLAMKRRTFCKECNSDSFF